MGLFALLLSIISLVFSFVAPILTGSSMSYSGIIMSICCIVLSAAARKKGSTGLGTAALVISILALVFGIIVFVACFACNSCAGAVGEAVDIDLGGLLG